MTRATLTLLLDVAGCNLGSAERDITYILLNRSSAGDQHRQIDICINRVKNPLTGSFVLSLLISLPADDELGDTSSSELTNGIPLRC